MKRQNQKDEVKHVFHIEQDGTITPHAMVRGSAVAEIPPGVYSLVFDEPTPMRPARIYLRPENNFKLPERIYGSNDINKLVDRFFKSYELLDKNMGVALIGEKGSGKTMLLKAMSAKAIEMTMPVILVDEKIPGSVLNHFFSIITQPALVNFDEFEKNYEEEEDQTAILRLLDGTNTGSKKMYCFTINDRSNVSQYMFGRPSRIRYVLPFKRLELSTVVDYVQTNLKNCTEDHLRAFIHMALCDGQESNGMNFDSMVEFVHEMNMFGGDLGEVLAVMGEKGKESWSFFEVTAFKDNQKIFRTVATGEHYGPYLGRDELELRMTINTLTTTPEERRELGATKREIIKLTEQNFVSFGDAYDTMLFEHEGVSYNLRYSSHKATQRIASEMEEDLGKQLRERKMVAARQAALSTGPSTGPSSVGNASQEADQSATSSNS